MQVSLEQSYFRLFLVFSSFLICFNSIRELMNGDNLPLINYAVGRFDAQKALFSRIQKTPEALQSLVLHGCINASSERQNFPVIGKTHLNKLVNIIADHVRGDTSRDTYTLAGGLKIFVRVENNFACVVKCQTASIREY